MNLFFWRKNKLIDNFANSMANELFSAVQPQQAREYFESSKSDKQTRKNSKNVEARINEVIKQTRQFRVSNSLGVYGKARLHLKFTERLKELGYEPATAKKINEMVLLKTP